MSRGAGTAAEDRAGVLERRLTARRTLHGLARFLLLVCTFGATALAAAPAAHAARPVACFTQSVANPVPGEPVTFDSSCSRDPGGTIKGRAWDTDDDNTVNYDDHFNAVTVTLTFPAPGTYRIKLAVVDDDNEVDTEIQNITVNSVPSASFTSSPTAPQAGDTVTFTSTSSDSDGTIAAYAWALDADGEFDDGSGAAAARTFDTPGSYVVKLRVTDNRGAQSIATGTVEVAARAPGAEPEPGQTFDTTTPLPVTPLPVTPGIRLLDPFPTVRIRGRTMTNGVKLSLFRVNAPKGSRVKISCSGGRCPAKSMTTRVKSSGVRIRRLERTLRAGTVLRVYVTRRGFVGKYTRFKIRRLELPARTDRCLMPGSTKPVSCP